MSGLITRARILRATIENLAITLDDEVAAENAELFPKWSGNGVNYITGDRIRYEGILYKVLMNHTSQEGWTPESAPSLYAKVLIPDPDVIPVWEQPDSTNPYMRDDKVHYPTLEDPVYISLIDNNVWSPDVTTAWALFEDDTPTPDPDPEPTPEPEPDPEPEPTPEPEPEPEPDPTEEIPEWVQPDSTNPYMAGDKVTHNGAIWTSTVDNNVWEPGIYGWEEVDE